MKDFVYADSNYILISYLSDSKILKIQWKKESENMSVEDFKQQISFIREAVIQYKPYYILGLTVEMTYGITPELQEWHNDFLFSAFRDEKLQKLAVIVSEDIFTQVSIEQLIEDEKDASFITQYFDKEADALDWLLG